MELTTHVRGSPFSVKVNQKPYEAELMGGLKTIGDRFSIKVGEKVYEVELNEINRKRSFPIKVNGVPLNVESKPAARKVVSKAPEVTASPPLARPSRRAVVEGAVTAPMAGKIVSILVEKGTSVKIGDVLCVLEAMKMENEITATKTGVIQEIKISEGMPVNEGEVLLTIK